MVLGILVALGGCFYTIRSKFGFCVKCRSCLKIESENDAALASEADLKQQNGLQLSDKENRALKKSGKMAQSVKKRVERKKGPLESLLGEPPSYDDIEDSGNRQNFRTSQRSLNSRRNMTPVKHAYSKLSNEIPYNS